MIIAIADHKGGVGKTTTAAALAQGLAVMHPRKKTLLIDADAQGTATRTLYGASGDRGGLYDVLFNGASAADLVETTEAGDILPYSRELASLDTKTAKNPNRYTMLRDALADLRTVYDFIIIDTPPGLGVGILQALTAADAVLIPISADPELISSIMQIHASIETIQNGYNPALQILGAVFTMYDGRAVITRQHEEYITQLCKRLKIPVCKTHIRNGVKVKEAHALKKSLFVYAPKAKPTEDYRELIKELKL